MGKEQAGFFILMVVAIFLMVIGFQGNLGLTFAIIFTPAKVTIQE